MFVTQIVSYAITPLSIYKLQLANERNLHPYFFTKFFHKVPDFQKKNSAHTRLARSKFFQIRMNNCQFTKLENELFISIISVALDSLNAVIDGLKLKSDC